MSHVVCFDLRCLQIGHENRGIGMHARSILENLDRSGKFTYIFYSFDRSDPVTELKINIGVPYTLVTTPTIKTSVDTLPDFIKVTKLIFHSFKELRDIKIDTFVQFDFMLGLPRLQNVHRTVLMAYDLIPLIFKADYIPSPLLAFRSGTSVLGKVKKTLRAFYYQERYRYHYRNFYRADLLISISENTADSLVNILGIDRRKIAVIPLAPVFNTTTPTRPHHLKTSKPFIFYIGATDARKRVADLIDAYSTVRKAHDIDLVLAGKEFESPETIPNHSILAALDNTPYRQNIHTLGYLSDNEKLWLYKNALAFVFPTAYEGFGLPIVEALQNGCPVISYDNSSIREVSQEATILTPTGDTKGLARAIEQLLTDSPQRQKMIQLGLLQSKKYSWTNYMRQFYQLLQD